MLSRQQIRERKRHLQKEQQAKRKDDQTLAELTEAERLLDQRRASAEQMTLQRGSLAVAILSQIPEHRPNIDGIAKKAIFFLDALLQHGIDELPEEDEDEEEDQDEGDEPDEDMPLAENVA